MKCDRCENEATVHEVMISGGKSMERHLCERCAAAAGVQIQPQQPPAVTQILSQMIKGAAAGGQPGQPKPPAQAAASACTGCGLSFAQFRQAGMLGCPQCYISFEGQLGPLLSRAHEGGTHHVGKIPRSLELLRTAPPQAGAPGQESARARVEADARAQEQARAEVLRRQLAVAVSSENYERAATLRDELRKLEAILRSAVAPAGSPSLARSPRATRKPKPDQGNAGAEEATG